MLKDVFPLSLTEMEIPLHAWPMYPGLNLIGPMFACLVKKMFSIICHFAISCDLSHIHTAMTIKILLTVSTGPQNKMLQQMHTDRFTDFIQSYSKAVEPVQWSINSWLSMWETLNSQPSIHWSRTLTPECPFLLMPCKEVIIIINFITSKIINK